MEWSEFREYSDRPLELPFLAQIRVDIADNVLSSPFGRRLAARELENQIEAFCTHVASEFAAILGATDPILRPNAVPVASLPWIRYLDTDIQPFTLQLNLRLLSEALTFDQPLAGQGFTRHIRACSFSVSPDPNRQTRSIEITIEAIELFEGSVWAKIKGAIVISTTAATLALAAFSTPPAAREYDEWRFEQRITRTVAGQHCESKATWTVDLKSLQALTLDQLDFMAPHLSPQEKALRVCNVQLALDISQGSPQQIDGRAGTKTMKALHAYAVSHNLPQDIRDETLRGQLLDELQRLRK